MYNVFLYIIHFQFYVLYFRYIYSYFMSYWKLSTSIIGDHSGANGVSLGLTTVPQLCGGTVGRPESVPYQLLYSEAQARVGQAGLSRLQGCSFNDSLTAVILVVGALK